MFSDPKITRVHPALGVCDACVSQGSGLTGGCAGMHENIATPVPLFSHTDWTYTGMGAHPLLQSLSFSHARKYQTLLSKQYIKKWCKPVFLNFNIGFRPLTQYWLGNTGDFKRCICSDPHQDDKRRLLCKLRLLQPSGLPQPHNVGGQRLPSSTVTEWHPRSNSLPSSVCCQPLCVITETDYRLVTAFNFQDMWHSLRVSLWFASK